MLDALRRGDRIVTGGGFFGTVSKVVSPEEVEVDLAPNVRVRVSAQHDLERPGQARPGRRARGGRRNATPPRKPGKRNRPAAPPTRYSEAIGFRCAFVARMRPRAARCGPLPGWVALSRVRRVRCNMLYFANWKVILICAVCAAGVLLSIPNLFTEQQLAALPRWVPHKQVSLGLDLRGGSYLLLEVDVAAAERERLNSVEETVRNALRDAKIGYTGLAIRATRSTFTIRDPAQIAAARQALAQARPRSCRRDRRRRGRHDPLQQAATRRPAASRPSSSRSRSSAAASTRPAPRSRRSSARARTASWCSFRASTIRSTSRRCSGAPPS